jgi:nicotinate-nucleotide adenylyltransferase
MNVGIFGGSFDPPHVGHLLAAQDVIEVLSLDALQVVPVATQPLKRAGRTAAPHRLAMSRISFGNLPGVVVDPIEIERGGLSFTVDTAEAYRRQWPTADLYLVIGEDAVASFPQWREPARLLSMVRLVVLSRSVSLAVHDTAAASLNGEFWVGKTPPLRLASRRVDVSSTEIRARVKTGRSLRGFVPDAVAAYIASTGLYLQEPEALV